MANEEHVARLLAGVSGWNRWRQERWEVMPDLREADLSRANLSGAVLFRAVLMGAKLSRANLSGAKLSQAVLSGTDLSRADLSGAKLSRAVLSNANLEGADLERADLERANLERANLERANLEGADLEGADLFRADLSGAVLSGAFFDSTIVRAVDLRDVHGLDTITHYGPSTIGIDTLYASGGDIPESFLRGCGVPNSMIEYARALVAAERPIDYYSCFISYSSHDEALAERLHADLQARGVRCWFAPHDLTPGAYIVRGIDEAIRLHDKVVLLLSEASIKSHWVLHEVTTAQTREAREGRVVLYPVRLDDSVLTTVAGWAAELCAARHIGDFRQWEQHQEYQKVFKRLLADLTAPPATP